MSKKGSKKGQGYIFKRGSIYYLQYNIDGKRKIVSLKCRHREDKADENGEIIEGADTIAQRILLPLQAKKDTERARLMADMLIDTEKRQEELAEKYRNKLQLTDTWDKYLDSHERPDSGQATLRQYSFQWNRFVNWVADNCKDMDYLSQITSEIAQKYVKVLKDDLSAGTVNKHVRLCKLVFTTLGDQENIATNPFGKIRSLKEQQNHRRELSWDKLKEICDKADGELKLLMFIGIYTGLRLGDCCLLTWDEIDLMRGWISTVPNKTARRDDTPIKIPIMQHLRNMLEDIAKSKRKGYVLPNLAKKYKKSRDNVTDMVQELFKACGVEIYKPGTGRHKDPETGELVGERAVLQYGFHSLRHTTVTILQEAGTPQAVVQAIVGHRTLAMTNRYTHIGDQALQQAVNNIPLLGTGEKNREEMNARRQLKELADSASFETIKEALELLIS